MIFDVLEAKLRTAGFRDGETLFRNHMPAEITRGVMLRTPLAGIDINEQIPGFYRGEIQAVIRHDDAIEGARTARRVQRALTTQTREHFAATEEHGEGHLDKCVPLHLPIEFPRLDGNALEWSQKFKLVFGMKDA